MERPSPDCAASVFWILGIPRANRAPLLSVRCRCLLLGEPAEPQDCSAAVESLVQQLEAAAAQGGAPALSQQQLATLRALLAALLQAGSSLGPAAVQAAASQLCSSLRLSIPPGQLIAALQSGAASESCSGEEGSGSAAQPKGSTRAAGRRRAGTATTTAPAAAAAAGAAAEAEVEAQDEPPSSSVAPAAAAAARGRRAKTVTFQVEEAEQPELAASAQQQPATQGRGRRAASSRAGGRAAAAAAVTPAPAAEGDAGEACSSPPTAAGGPGGNLCEVFESMSLEQPREGPEGEQPRPRALTTVRASKHRSRQGRRLPAGLLWGLACCMRVSAEGHFSCKELQFCLSPCWNSVRKALSLFLLQAEDDARQHARPRNRRQAGPGARRHHRQESSSHCAPDSPLRFRRGGSSSSWQRGGWRQRGQQRRRR